MSSDIHTLANMAAEKIRGGYKAPHAAHSALKELVLGAKEREKLFHEILRELSRRSRLRRAKNKKQNLLPQRLFEALREEKNRDAARLAYERGDHLLPDP